MENKNDTQPISEETVSVAEPTPETVSEEDFSQFDNEAEAAKEQAARDAQAEADKELPPDPNALLEVRHLKKYFTLKKTFLGKTLSELRAVDDVSFKLYPGETLGIVGESGCGKTTMGRTILKLHQPTGGQIFFNGQDITDYTTKQMHRPMIQPSLDNASIATLNRPLRTQMQIIFQDPYSSLPPRSPVGEIIAEAVKVHNIVPPDQVKDYVLSVMSQCGLLDYYYERYPHEFSGGQRQRICIARALAVKPSLVVCDEPVSALDVSIQAQIINLLKKLQEEMNLTYLFISHDLSVVKHISDRIGVMYLGSMVEFGSKESIFANPLHPYTQALFSAVPVPDPDAKMNRILLGGDIPSPANPPKGCKFHTRCPKAKEICKHIAPVYKEYEEGHFAACHLYPQD
ncbi:MAG: ATP-binding cassette domain-containing protein [Clostridia bacterium]|nr:ATP-binding cassette domain-containing protein [Clostridia bacterium]